jgi:hypothetical protein
LFFTVLDSRWAQGQNLTHDEGFDVLTPCSPLKANRRFGGIFRFHLQGESKRQGEQRRYVPKKRRLNVNGPIGFTYQKIEHKKKSNSWLKNKKLSRRTDQSTRTTEQQVGHAASRHAIANLRTFFFYYLFVSLVECGFPY